MTQVNDNDNAIVGMAIRVAGALTLEQYWPNLCDGVESLSLHTDAELAERDVSPAKFDRVGFCRIGSVKSHICHTDTVAGVVGLIKAVCSGPGYNRGYWNSRFHGTGAERQNTCRINQKAPDRMMHQGRAVGASLVKVASMIRD